MNDGRIEVDQSALTGESLPVSMYKGDSAKMGSTVTRGGWAGCGTGIYWDLQGFNRWRAGQAGRAHYAQVYAQPTRARGGGGGIHAFGSSI